eukprot:s3768_g6.t1
MDYLINRATLITRVQLPTIAELVDETPNQWSRNRGYAKIHTWLPGGVVAGKLEMARARGENYIGRAWIRPTMFGDEWMEKFNRYDEKCSHRVNMVLRHNIGVVQTPDRHRGLKCDEGCWVNILDLLLYNFVWDDGFDIWSDDSRNYHILAQRLERMMKYVWYEVKVKRNVRFQVIGLKLKLGELRSPLLAPTIVDAGIDMNAYQGRPDNEELWMWPVAIRASTGHSKISYGVQYDDKKVSLEIDHGIAQLLGGAFHETTFQNMHSIMSLGLLPGGPKRIRASSMFIPFAPWDHRANDLIKRKNTIPPINCAIFLSYDKLLKYNARIGADGKIVIGEMIPFSDFDAVWYFDDENRCSRRLITPVGKNQFISSIAKCKGIASMRRFHTIKRKVLFEASPGDKEVVERIEELDTKIEKGILSIQQGNEIWGELVSLFTLIYIPDQSGYALYPGCLYETPSILALCVHCEGMLLSHGCRHEVVQDQESEDEMTIIPDDPVIEVHDHVKEAMEKIKEEGELDAEMEMEQEDDFPEEIPELSMAEGHDDGDVEDIATDASGLQQQMEFDREEQDAINVNLGVSTEDATASTIREAPVASVVEPDADDPIMTLHVEQFSVVHDMPIRLSQRVRQWDFRTKTLTEEMSMCLDSQRRASMIMDLQVGVSLNFIYNVFYLRYVGGKPDSVEKFFQDKPNIRPDLDGDFPFYGVDEDGNYADPPDEETLVEWARTHMKRLPSEYAMRAYRGALFFKKIVQYCLECGLKKEDLAAQFASTQADKTIFSGTDERAKLAAKSQALTDLARQSEYMRRIYKGAFGCNAHSYFRPESMQNTMFIPPDEILICTRDNCCRISSIYMVDAHGYRLPEKILHAYYLEIEKTKKNKNFFPIWGVHLHQDHIKAITDDTVSVTAAR